MELGSEYNLNLSDLSKTKNNLFSFLSEYKYCHFLDSGRSAIREFASLLKDGEEILLPEYICESVINCFDIKNVGFYKINKDFSIDIKDLKGKISDNTKVVFLMHYFGSLQSKEILVELKTIADEHSLVILEDTTHSIFSRARTIGDYMVCSIRKWMPLSKGGVLYVENDKLGLPRNNLKKSTDNKRINGFILKDLFLNNQLSCNAKYRDIFSECEDDLDNQKDSFLMSDLNHFIVECTDVFEIIKRRKQNAKYLLNEINKDKEVSIAVKFEKEDCPFAFPIRIKNRDKFRKYLIDHQVYCAVHWPADGIRDDERVQNIKNSEELLSLPIDQRYSQIDLDYMIKVISEYKGDLLF